MNDLLRKNNDQPTNNIDVSCVQTVGLKHAKILFCGGCAGCRIGTRFLRPRGTSPLKGVQPRGNPGV